MLRCSSVYIRNGEGKVIGCLCVNFDVSDLLMADKALGALLSGPEAADPEKAEEFFVNDVNQLLDALLQKVQEEIGKPAAYMTREEKISAEHFLDRKGAFLITKSGDRICQYLDISKFTLYSYLGEVHAELPKR